MPGAVVVEGLRELEILFAAAGRQANRDLRSALRKAAEPVRRDAEALALSKIRRMTIPWSQMRVGVTRQSVYVAPKLRGVKSGNPHDPRRRHNLVALMLDRAMEPALEANKAEVIRAIEEMLDRVAHNFNRDV